MNSMVADPQLSNRSDVRGELPDRPESVLQPIEDEMRDGDLTELTADAPTQAPRDADLVVRDLVFGKSRHVLDRSFERC